MVRGDGVRDGLHEHGLAGARRSDDQTALALADGAEEIHDAAADVLAHGLHLDALLRIERREVVEENLVAGLFGRLEVDGFDLDEREVLLAFVRRAHVAGDGVAGLEVELADLRGRDVDVVGAGQVVVVGAAEEAVAVGQDLEDSLGEDVAFFFALRLKNLEDEVLLAESAGASDFEAAGELAEFGNALFFQLSNCHGCLVDFRSMRGILDVAGMWCCGDVEVRCGDSVLRGGARASRAGVVKRGRKLKELLEGRHYSIRIVDRGEHSPKSGEAAAAAFRPRGEPLPRSLRVRQRSHPWGWNP